MASPETMRCLGCGYDLRGLPENRCPECGRAFDPTEPTTYITRVESGRRYLVLALLAVVIIVVALTLAWLADRRDTILPFSDWWVLLAGPLLVAGVCLQFYVLTVSIVALRRPRGAREHSTCWLGALVLSVLTIGAFIAMLLTPSYS